MVQVMTKNQSHEFSRKQVCLLQGVSPGVNDWWWWCSWSEVNNSVQVRWNTLDKYPTSRLGRLRSSLTSKEFLQFRNYFFTPWPKVTPTWHQCTYEFSAVLHLEICLKFHEVTESCECQNGWFFSFHKLALSTCEKIISSEGALVAIPLPVFHITSSRTSKSLYNLLTHFNNFEHLCQ